MMQDDKQLGQSFWNSRWENRQTGWDIGHASPAITQYMQNYLNKEAAILIPGCGNAHEANFLINNGFTNITLVDIAPLAVETLSVKYKGLPQVKVICGDFFELNQHYDLIIEQTFFCALAPSLRPRYVKKAASLLNEKGSIIGLLFDTLFEKEGPPFGGSKAEYLALFQQHFTIKKMETCYNSIPPRMGKELFINLVKYDI